MTERPFTLAGGTEVARWGAEVVRRALWEARGLDARAVAYRLEQRAHLARPCPWCKAQPLAPCTSCGEPMTRVHPARISGRIEMTGRLEETA